MSNEAVKVVVRCRPLFGKEITENRKPIIICDTELGTVAIQNPKAPDAKPKKFTFDAVYDPDSTQRNVYDETGYPLVESVMQGYNGTMFAYGQTGCGKTHTMQGRDEPRDLRGIIPNSFDHIFENIKIASAKEFLVRCAYLEIYNEEIRDLLGADPKAKVNLKEDPERGVFVKGLTDIVVDSVEAIDNVMKHGHKNRTVGATLMNAESSRSHSIFTIIIEANEQSDDGQDHFTKGKLNLVDLAGSERPSKTGATGARMKEGIKINMSLTALGNVISALVDGKPHIPYRDSKLTRLLQDSLGGNTKTVMMAAISPADYNHDETMSTLRYANRAKNIKNKPVVNEDPKDALLRQYKDEIERLKNMLATQASMSGNGSMPMTAAAGAAAAAGMGGAPTTPLNRGPSAHQLRAESLRAQLADATAGAGGAGAGGRLPGVSEAAPAEPTVITKTVEKIVYRDGPAPEPQVVEKVVYKDGPAPQVVEKVVYRDGPAPEAQVVEKVVEKNVEVVPKQLLEQQAAMQNYNKSIVEQRNKMGMALEAKAEEIEKERRQREELESRLNALQSKVMGHAVLGGILGGAAGGAGGAAGDGGADDPEVILAKQQAAHRKAQLKLKREKKRQAKLKEAQKKALEAQRMAEEESKMTKEAMEARTKELKKTKHKYANKIASLQQELQDTKEEFDRHREVLMNTVREQTKETKLLEQLIALFLPSTELGKVWERAVWDEEAEEWTLPTIKPRKQYSQVVKLPTLGGGVPEQPEITEESPRPLYQGGAVVASDSDDNNNGGGGYRSSSRAGGHRDKDKDKERERRRRKKKEAERARRKKEKRERPTSSSSRAASRAARHGSDSNGSAVGQLDLAGASPATSPHSHAGHTRGDLSHRSHRSHRSSAPQLSTAHNRVLASGGEDSDLYNFDDGLAGVDMGANVAPRSLGSSPEAGFTANGGAMGIAGTRRPPRKDRSSKTSGAASHKPPRPKSNTPTLAAAAEVSAGDDANGPKPSFSVMQGNVPDEIPDEVGDGEWDDATNGMNDAQSEAERQRRKEERRRRKERHKKKKKKREREERRRAKEAAGEDGGEPSPSDAGASTSAVDDLSDALSFTGADTAATAPTSHRHRSRPSSRGASRRRHHHGSGGDANSAAAMGFNATPNTWDGDGASNGGHRSRRGSSSRHGKRPRRRSGADKHKGGDADAGGGGGIAGNGGPDGVGNKQYVDMLERCWSPDEAGNGGGEL